MTSLERIRYYSTANCVEYDDVVEIIYTLCSNCPISVKNVDNIALTFRFPNGESVDLFSFADYPASLVLHVGKLRKRLEAYGYFPFELEKLTDFCAPNAIAKTDDDIYLGFDFVVQNLHAFVDSVQGFSKIMYIR